MSVCPLIDVIVSFCLTLSALLLSVTSTTSHRRERERERERETKKDGNSTKEIKEIKACSV